MIRSSPSRDGTDSKLTNHNVTLKQQQQMMQSLHRYLSALLLLQSLMPWPLRSALERLAPTHLEVPSGSRIALDYSEPTAPVLAVKLQEVFGWTSTPMLMDGRVSLTLQLLSPAQRPVQVTRDLAGFWRSSYFEVRKELRGRYPRHPWPEDPLTAEATRRAKPRGT